MLENDLRSTLESDPVGVKISAVENDHVYPQGARYQGPILNLFQLEMSAKQFYPDQFGEWPTSDGGPYPEFPEDEQLSTVKKSRISSRGTSNDGRRNRPDRREGESKPPSE